MKKSIATVWVAWAVVVLLIFSGCSGGGSGTAAPPASATASPAASESPLEEPTDEPLPEDEPSPEEEGPTEPMPTWQGGSYEFATGVVVTTKVELVEPWGEKTDFCDGCMPLRPADTRFALRYTVKVPKGYEGSLDASDCGGELSVDSGNDDEAIVGVAGEVAKSLDGQIRAGQTKFGIEEWGIKKKYRTEGFTWTTTCGDPSGEEMGVWAGKIPANTSAQPEGMGKPKKIKYFEVGVDQARQTEDGYLIKAYSCLKSIPPGFEDGYVPSSTAPWSVTAGGKRVKPDPDNDATSYESDATLDLTGLPCNEGWIYFPTKGKKVTSINYENSLGSKTAWKVG